MPKTAVSPKYAHVCVYNSIRVQQTNIDTDNHVAWDPSNQIEDLRDKSC